MIWIENKFKNKKYLSKTRSYFILPDDLSATNANNIIQKLKLELRSGFVGLVGAVADYDRQF